MKRIIGGLSPRGASRAGRDVFGCEDHRATNLKEPHTGVSMIALKPIIIFKGHGHLGWLECIGLFTLKT